MGTPRKFSEKIALHNQRQAEETAEFNRIMRECNDVTNTVNSGSRRARVKAQAQPVEKAESTLRPNPQGLGCYRSESLPNVAAPQATNIEPEQKPEEATLATQYNIGGNRSGGTSPSRSPGQRGRASASVGPMRRPADRRHDTSPYGSTVYLSPPQDWRRTNSDSALHQSSNSGEQQSAQLSPHHTMHSHSAGVHLHPHQNHRRGDIHLDVLLGMNPNNRPRSSSEIPRIPNNNNVYESGREGGGGGGVAGGGGGVGGGLVCGELQVPGGSLPDLTALHFPPHAAYMRQGNPSAQQQQQHTQQQPASPSPPYHQHTRYSPTSPGAVSPGGGSVSPATGGLSPASGSPVGATVPLTNTMHHPHDHTGMYDAQNHLSVPNTNNYLHHNQNMSPLEHGWMSGGYQSHCSPPSQYSSTSNINIPSPTMVHSPGSPAESSPQNTDYGNLHQLLQPFEQITMLDQPSPNYNSPYMNHGSPHSPQQQTTNQHQQHQSTAHTYPQSPHPASSGNDNRSSRGTRDPVPGYPTLQPLASPPATPASIPDIILTDYSGELDAGIFGGEEAQLRAGLDLDDLTLLDSPSALLPDSTVEHEFRLDRL